MSSIPFDPVHGPLSLPLSRSWEPLPPHPVSEGVPPSRTVRLAELSPEKKRRLWAWMKQNDAALADQLAGPDVRALLDAFPGASPVLDIGYVERALS